MSSTPKLVRAFISLSIGGVLVMLPALFVAAPLSSYIMRVGMTCICLACCMNVISAVKTQKMWGRFTMITPNTTTGGATMFYGLAALYGTLAIVCAIGACAFISKT